MLSRFLTTKEQWVLLCVAAAIGIGGIALCVYHGTGTAQLADAPGASPQTTPLLDTAELPPAAPPSDETPDSVENEEEPLVQTTPSLRVAAQGNVRRPGLYTMRPGDRLQDLLDRAGGLDPNADTSDLNLAAPLIDGTTLTVPAKPAPMDGQSRALARRDPPAPVLNPAPYTISGQGLAVAAATGIQGTSSSPAQPLVAPGSPNQAGLLDLNTATAEQLETLPGIGTKRASDIVRYRSLQPFQSVDDLQNIRGIGPKTVEGIRPLVTVGSGG